MPELTVTAGPEVGNRPRGKTALVLAGGGITGGVYEMGALRALDDILVDRTVNDFDIYVGTSAGSFVASLLANGVDPASMLLAAQDPKSDLNRLLWRNVYTPNFQEWQYRLGKVPGIAFELLQAVARARTIPPASELFMTLSPLLPSGLLDSEGVRRFLNTMLEAPGLHDRFSQLKPELNIVTTRLDNFERVVFGPRYRNDVRISTAVAASTAVPLLYRPMPVRGQYYMDGGVKGIASIDVALEGGADLVVIINPLVPIDMSAVRYDRKLHRQHTTIYDLGVRAIYNQVLRGLVHDSLLTQLEDERQRHPNADFILIEPRPDDQKMFFHEVMSSSARLMVAQHGYESVTVGLEQSWDYVAEVLGRHGVKIRRDRRKSQVVAPEAAAEDDELIARLQRTVLAAPRRRSAVGGRPIKPRPHLRLVKTLEDLDRALG